MQVILLKELKGKGGEGDVIDVAPGFANNYLLTQGYAILATKGNLKQLEARKHNIAKREAQRLADDEALKAQADVEMDRRRIEINTPIKTAGVHDVTVGLYRTIKATLKVAVGVEVEAEPAAEEAVEAAEAPEATEE